MTVGIICAREYITRGVVVAPQGRLLFSPPHQNGSRVGTGHASGFIVLSVCGAILRDVVRAGGYSALKLEPGGPQMDETLNSLLRSAAARNVLGAAHCDLVEYVM